MGLFLALSGVIGVNEIDVVTALSGYAKAKHGIFRPEPRTHEDDDTLVVYSAHGNTSLLFPQNSTDWWDVSQALSLLLKRSVLSLHIHDGDFWMYILYRNGVQIDGFNPIPDYWIEDISNEERESYKGNAAVVCKCIPGIQPGAIEKYFVTWNVDSDEELKAYPEDKYPCGTDWQMLDFMEKLSLPYPLDSNGRNLGSTYKFSIPVPTSTRQN
jgi:hypothetical protein